MGKREREIKSKGFPSHLFDGTGGKKSTGKEEEEATGAENPLLYKPLSTAHRPPAHAPPPTSAHHPTQPSNMPVDCRVLAVASNPFLRRLHQ